MKRTKETIVDRIIVLDDNGFPEDVLYTLVYMCPVNLIERISCCIPVDLKVTVRGCKYYVVNMGKVCDSACLIPKIFEKIKLKHVNIMKDLELPTTLSEEYEWLI